MIPNAETLKRIRRIELHTRRLVNNSFAGSYHAIFKGRGMAFESVRAYEPGDDVRDIDWNVTARTGEPFIKRFTEERELTVMLLLDASGSVLFGTSQQIKKDIAAELGAVIAFSAISNNDKVGLMIFSDQTEVFIPPRKGRNHILRLIRDLITTVPDQKGTDIGLALRNINRYLKRRSIIFLISDFLSSPNDYKHELMLTSRYHDVIAITLSDPLEHDWPRIGLVGLRDAETDAPLWVNTGSQQWGHRFKQQGQKFRKLRDEILNQARVDRIDIPLDRDYVRALAEFFRQRERRLHL